MKKITTTLLTAVLLVSLTGCKPNEESPDTPNSPGDSSAITDSSDNSGNSGSPNSSTASDSAPEPPKPTGEPTFLTAPDGTPIYTSEISEIYTGSEEFDNKKTITLEQAEQIAQTGDGDFTIKCDGFVYGYIPERALNRVDDPEMFKDSGSGKSFKYLGEKFDVNSFEGKCSTEYMRIKVGDKFGTLTVKNAYTLFEDKSWNPEDDFSDIPGIYISDRCVEFDGELEMTGYVEVTPEDTLYGMGGDMIFYPDGDSSVILPDFDYFLNRKSRKICHFAVMIGAGFYGYVWFNIGNMYQVDCDTSGLNPGDSFVKVKVVLDNIRYAPGHQMGGWKFDLKSIEVL